MYIYIYTYKCIFTYIFHTHSSPPQRLASTDVSALSAQEMAPAVDWSCLVASIMTATAVVFELSALIVEYSASGGR